ncbi:MAG: hypothetical protein AAF467_17305 [Actinomycetota bacterium]
MLSSDEQTALVARISAGPKYRTVHGATVTDVVAHAAANHGTTKAAEKWAREVLHQIKADYLLNAKPSRVEAQLVRRAAAGESVATRCRAALELHRSWSERTASVDDYYQAILDLADGADEVADVACAMGPFSVPLFTGDPFRYRGFDLNTFYVELPAKVLGAAAPPVEHVDVVAEPERVVTDVAVLMKTYHCLENRQTGLGWKVVAGIDARCVVVSFPQTSFGGRPLRTVERHMVELERNARGQRWTSCRSTIDDEALVAVHKGRRG